MKKKHRILYLRATSMPGAGTRVMMGWVKWLNENGYGIYVGAPNGGWLKEELAKFANRRTIDADFFIPKGKEYIRFAFLIIRLCFFVIRNRIGLIHCNSDVAYFTAITVGRLTRRPVVTHLRYHYTEEFYSWLFGGWRKPDMVVLVSEAFRKEEVKKIHSVCPGIPVRALHNCIDLTRYPPVSTEDKTVSCRVFYPAAISLRKRQAQLYQIDSILQKKGCKLQFVAAGKINEPGYWNLCQSESEKYPQNNVEFIGHVNDVAAQYRKSLLSLTLSEYETFGYSVLESMASGIPVVGYRIGPVEEVLGESGCLVEVDDVESVACAIHTLSSDRGKWQDYSRRGRDRASHYFSPDHICPILIEMYEEVLGDHKRGES